MAAKTSTCFALALEEWSRAMDAGALDTTAADLKKVMANVTGLHREVLAVLRPKNTEEVVEIVRIAGRHRVPIYPFSRGQNWGLGSRLPVLNGCALVDLQRMDRIHEVNVEGAYAVIEPGVTQRQLYDELERRQAPLMFNVTGSGAGSSVIGNALERGIGYLTSKAGSLSGLEIVMGTGELLHTGFGHYAGCETTHHYRYGVGPSLDEVFSQSNFGIITRAGIALRARPPSAKVVVCRKRASVPLATFIHALIKAHRAGILNSVVHVGNRHRAEVAMAPLAADFVRRRRPGLREEEVTDAVREFLRRERFGDWTAVGTILGEPSMTASGVRLAGRWLRRVGHLMIFDEARLRAAERLVALLSFLPAAARKRALLPSIREHIGLCHGIPTSEPVKSAYWAVGMLPPPGVVDVDPDRSVCGMMFVLPVIPMNGKAAQEAVNIVETAFGAAGFRPYITLNLVDQRFIEGVINASFRTDDPVEVARAHALIEDLQKQLQGRGWYPYRVGIQAMGGVVSEDDPFWQVVRRLKDVFDPNHIIAPGRYNLV